MTVGKLISLLSEFPEDSEVTDVGGNAISKVVGEKVGREDPDEMVVWLDTDYIFNIDDID